MGLIGRRGPISPIGPISRSCGAARPFLSHAEPDGRDGRADRFATQVEHREPGSSQLPRMENLSDRAIVGQTILSDAGIDRIRPSTNFSWFVTKPMKLRSLSE